MPPASRNGRCRPAGTCDQSKATPLPPLRRQLWLVRHPGKRVAASLRRLLALDEGVFADA